MVEGAIEYKKAKERYSKAKAIKEQQRSSKASKESQ